MRVSVDKPGQQRCISQVDNLGIGGNRSESCLPSNIRAALSTTGFKGGGAPLRRKPNTAINPSSRIECQYTG